MFREEDGALLMDQVIALKRYDSTVTLFSLLGGNCLLPVRSTY